MKKPKITKAKHAKLEQDWADHNRWLRSMNLSKISYDEYLTYRYGRVKVVSEFTAIKATVKQQEIFQQVDQQRTQYPSLVSDSDGVCEYRENPRYTGTLIRGISTMHKSNAVPVLSTDEMQEHARMRR